MAQHTYDYLVKLPEHLKKQAFAEIDAAWAPEFAKFNEIERQQAEQEFAQRMARISAIHTKAKADNARFFREHPDAPRVDRWSYQLKSNGYARKAW